MESRLREMIKEAMVLKKETGESLRYQTLKNVLEKAQKYAKDKLIDVISDDIVVISAKKELKQLEEELGYYEVGSERYNEVIIAIEVVKELLPKSVTESELMGYLIQLGNKNIGVCMKALKAEYGSSLDGKLASEVVKKYIAG